VLLTIIVTSWLALMCSDDVLKPEANSSFSINIMNSSFSINIICGPLTPRVVQKLIHSLAAKHNDVMPSAAIPASQLECTLVQFN